jgi:hypothetical protein
LRAIKYNALLFTSPFYLLLLTIKCGLFFTGKALV